MSCSQILLNAWGETPLDHRKSLLGERPASSQWGRDFTSADLRKLQWERFEPMHYVVQEGCLYYRADISERFPDAVRGAFALHAYLGFLDEIFTVEGPHGPELQAAFDGPLPRATVATLILGPHDDGKLVVYTVHPGIPLVPGADRNNPFTAVKAVLR